MRSPIAALPPALLVLTALTAPGLLLHPARAQAPETPSETRPAERFGEAIAITEVEVPVQVLHRGEPVRGLTADDFVVLDEGEPAEVIAFRAIDLEIGSAGAGDRLSGAARANGPAAVGPGDGRHILFLFDFLFSSGHQIEKALFRSRSRITDGMHPADRIAVGYLSGGGARIVLGFSGDAQEIRSAFDLIEAMSDGRGQDAARLFRRLAEAQRLTPAGADELERDARPVAASTPLAGALGRRFGPSATVAMLGGVQVSSGDGWGLGLGGAGVPSFDGADSQDSVHDRLVETNPFALGAGVATAETSSRARAQTDQIAEVATLLRDVPGQKHLLLLSHGFSSELIYGTGVPERPLILRYLREMHEAVRRAGWTLHVFDTGGVPDPFVPWWFSNTDALFYVANETGGQLFSNFNLLPDATARLMAKTSVTYVLTIRPPDDLPANGRRRRLEVRLRDKPWLTRLHHRTAYYAPKPAADRSSLELKLDTIDLLLGEAESEGLPVAVEAEVGPASGGLAPVALLVTLPAHVFQAESGPTTQIQIQVYAVDPQGGVQDLWLRRVVVDREKVGGQLAAAGLQVAGTLSLPPGEYRLRSLVRHPASDRFSLRTTVLEIER
jgi:VWFA-related protein